jgi:large subunit ribosomal protein L9
MKSLEVLLRDHVKSLGRCGDVVRVRPGFARNYLFPRKLAVEATDENKRVMVRRAQRLAVEEAETAKQISATVAALAGVVLRTRQRADEQGHLYGSVSATVVAELLAASGHPVEERNVRLDAPIKTVGTHAIRVHVHGEEFATVTIEVQAE